MPIAVVEQKEDCREVAINEFRGSVTVVRLIKLSDGRKSRCETLYLKTDRYQRGIISLWAQVVIQLLVLGALLYISNEVLIAHILQVDNPRWLKMAGSKRIHITKYCTESCISQLYRCTSEAPKDVAETLSHKFLIHGKLVRNLNLIVIICLALYLNEEISDIWISQIIWFIEPTATTHLIHPH